MDKSIDNFYTFLIIFIIATAIYFIVIYFYDKNKKEKFDVPAPAALVEAPAPIQVPRQVSPSGPNPPNARIPEKIARLNDVYNIVASDPYDETYGSQNIQDNLRYPERSFSPGLMNTGTKLLTKSEVASNKMLNSAQPIQPFKPELVQNGGLLDNVGPDDTQTNPNYSSF
jgi:hypothetical protein